MDDAGRQRSKAGHRRTWSASPNAVVRKITLACALQHSQSFRPGGHWRQTRVTGG